MKFRNTVKFLLIICSLLRTCTCEDVKPVEEAKAPETKEGTVVSEGGIKVPLANENKPVDILPAQVEDSKALVDSGSKKKELKETEVPVKKEEENQIKTDNSPKTDAEESTIVLNKKYMPDFDNVSGFTQVGLILFLLSLFVVFFIMYRACKVKQTRGDRRYGGVTTSYHELAPITIEDDDSETEDQALFDLEQARAAKSVL